MPVYTLHFEGTSFIEADSEEQARDEMYEMLSDAASYFTITEVTE